MSIQHAAGFRPGFCEWCFKKLNVTCWYSCFDAPIDWLELLYKNLSEYVNQSCLLFKKKRTDNFRYKLDIDLLHFGGALTHALLRKPQDPRPGCMEITKTVVATLMRQTGKGDEERITCARAFRALKVWPEQLVPIQIALTPGAQTINRAELAAILQIARSCPTAIIYSDSAWAIEVFEAVRRTPVYSAHFHRANFDLVCDLVDLAISTDLGGIELHKIRSHQCYDDIHDDLQLFLALGNDKADMMAKEGTLRARSDLHQLCWEIAHWCNDQLKSLKHFSKLLVKMELQRLDAFDRRKSQQTETMNPADPNFLANWQVTNPQQLCSDDATPDNFLAGFLPGASFYLALRTWFSMLRWNDVPGGDIGISYFELACNFIGVTGICFPKVVSRGGSHTEYADERFSPDAILLHQSVWDLTRVLEHAIRLSSKMLDVNFVPLALHQRKCFLQQYGYKGRVAGIMARPVLVEQSLHVEHMFQWAGPSGLTLPSQFSETPAFVVDVHELDELPFHQRLRAFYKLHNDSRNQ
eukprot:Skav219893  [mRNA]  locus=scaffold841:138942:142890:- [translate_table: standard]